MKFLVRLLVVLAAIAALPALAQSPPSKPYKATVATYDRAAENDAGLAALVRETRAAVEAKDVAGLSALISDRFVALDCAANPLKACAPGKAKAVGAGNARPIDRLRLAFCCEGKPSPETPEAAQNDTMFAILAADLGAGGLGANPDAKGEVCAPALPRLDRARAGAAARAAGVEPENLRVAAATIPLREKPAPGAATISRLDPGDLAPIVTDLTADTPSGWTAIALPDGAIGYTDALGLDELTPGAICFGKEKGRWKIVSTIQRGG
ncbi:MAG TPA: hypothetical protein PKA55_13465 [Rhodoblastus sp.]|nr:hypothetical protein [Rhodoblastus sp.]